jgi:hypothetical protein
MPSPLNSGCSRRSPDRDAALAAFAFVAALVAGRGLDARAEPVPSPGNEPAQWRSLFDGAGLGEWRPTAFGGGGEIAVAAGVIRIPMGADMSGITWAGDHPRQSYEIALQARRVDGSDFFCGLTFPVGDDCCSLIVGGWGGGLVGLSSIDGQDAANNATTKVMSFDNGRWYDVKVRVTPERIECFLDGEPVVDQPLQDRIISVRDEVIPSKPLGIATFATTAEVRDIRWRPIVSPTGAAAP